MVLDLLMKKLIVLDLLMLLDYIFRLANISVLTSFFLKEKSPKKLVVKNTGCLTR